MKKFKIRIVGMGIEAVGMIPFEKEPTLEEVENTTALYLNEKLMKIELNDFYTLTDIKNKHYTIKITYEELQKEKEKKLVLGEWV